MVEFAELVISAKTEQLKRAKGDLNETTVAAGRTDRAVDKTGKAFVKTGAQSKAATGAMAAGMKKAHIAVAALAAAALGLGTAIKVIAEFETSISKLGAISGATTTQLAQMRDVAKQLGSATEFSAGQAADGLTFLAQAGFTAQESIAAIPAVLDLATASGLGLAAAADTASNIMSGFGIAAGDAARVSDVLAAAAASSNTNVAQLGGAMSTVAPIAAALGIELEDTAAAIGIMSDAGIQGERAGTALRGVLAALAGPTSAATDVLKEMGLTIKDVDPATNDLADVLGKLQGAGLSTADAMTIFGREAASGALVLVKGADQVGTFTGKLQGADGAASDMAATMRDNLGGDIATLQSSLSGLILALGEAGLTAVLRGVIQLATGVARAFTSAVDAFNSLQGAVSGVLGDLFGFTTAQEIAQKVIDNGTLAMGDQIQQIQILTRSTKEGSIISEEAARVRLQEANSLIATLDATRALRKERLNESGGLNAALQEVARYKAELEELKTVHLRAAESGQQLVAGLTGGADEYAASLEVAERNLAEVQLALGKIVNSQRGLNLLSDDEITQRAELVELAAMLEAGIIAGKNGQVFLNGELVEGVDLSERLSSLASGISFAGAISSAQQLAKTLGVSVGLAQQLARVNAGGKAIEVNNNGQDALDPRNPNNTRPIFDGDFGTVSPFDPSRLLSFTSALSGGGGGGGGLTKALSDAADEIERLEFNADPLKKYNSEIAKLDNLMKAGLSKGAYEKAVADLNKEFEKSSPLIDGITTGLESVVDYALDGFKNGFKGVLDIVKNTLKSIAAAFLKQKFIVPITAAFSGVGGIASALGGGGAGAGAGAGAGGGGGGGLGGLTGGATLLGGLSAAMTAGGSLVGVTGLMGGLGAGAGMAVSGLMGGGLSGMTGAISAQVGAATTAGASITSMGAAIGAVAVPLLAVVAAFSFFKKKTKQLDSGIRLTVNGLDTLIEGFKVIQTKRFWGLSKKVSTSFNRLDASISGPLEKTLSNMFSGIAGTALALGIGADAFSKFSSQVTVSTKGLSKADANKAIERALLGLGNRFASMVPGLAALQNEGEGANAALTRLASSLATVNDVFMSLQFAAYDMSLAGADAASSFVDLFGTIDDFVASTAAYYDAFYTQDEKRANATARLSASLEALGINFIPNDRAGFRDLVDTAQIAGDSDLAASLIMLSPAFAGLTASVDQLSETIRNQVEERNFATGVDFRRGLSRASNGIDYTPQNSSAEMLVELKALNARVDLLQSTSEFTAANTGATANNTEDQLTVLETTT